MTEGIICSAQPEVPTTQSDALGVLIQKDYVMTFDKLYVCL